MAQNQLSLQQVIQYFAGIATQHKDIESFYYGPKWDVSVSNPAAFPIMIVIPQTSTVRKDSLLIKHKIQILDQISKDASNRDNVLSDSFQTCLDIKAYIFKDFFYDIFPTDESEIEPYYENYDDELGGWSMDVSLQLDWLADVCTIPGLYPNGVTFQGSNGYYSINLAAYLPLVGGVLTGPLTGTTASFNDYFSGGTELSTVIYNIAASIAAADIFTGGTVTGPTNFLSGLTSTTVSATTYLNLPQDVFVTGGTYNPANGTTILRRNDGNSISISGYFTGSTDVYVTGGTYNSLTGIETFTNNTGGTFTVSGFYTNANDIFVTGGTPNNSSKIYTFTNNTGGTFTVIGLTDINTTGGTYSNGSATFTNNTGGTFSVSGFFTGATDIHTTAFTYNNNTFTLTDNTNVSYNASINSVTGLTSSGLISSTNLSATTLSASTGFNFGLLPVAGYVMTTDIYGNGTWQIPATAGVQAFFLYGNESPSDIGGYDNMKPIASVLSAQTITNAGATTGQILASWVTPVGYPNLTFMPAGIMTFYISASQTAGSKSSIIFGQIYKRSSGGSETLLATTSNSIPLVGSTAAFILQAALSAQTTLLITDRIVVKALATISGGGSAPTIVLTVEDSTAGRLELPATIVDSTLFVPYTGATGSVYLGSNSLSALTGTFTSGATNGYYFVSNSGGTGIWTAGPTIPNVSELPAVISILNTPPTASTIGDRYLIGTSPTSYWSADTNQIAQATVTTTGATSTGWTYTTASTNNTVFVTSTLTTYLYNGSAWIAYNGVAILQNGNSLGNGITIGSNDNNSFNIKTSGNTKVSLNSSTGSTTLTIQDITGSTFSSIQMKQFVSSNAQTIFGITLYENVVGNIGSTNIGNVNATLISNFNNTATAPVVLSGTSIFIIPKASSVAPTGFNFGSVGLAIGSQGAINTSPAALLHLNSAQFVLPVSYPGFNKGAQLRIDGSIINTIPVSSGLTQVGFSVNSFGISSLNNNGQTGTITDATTVYIEGSPNGFGGVVPTITRPWSLYVQSGNTLFAGKNYFGGTGVTPTASIHVTGGTITDTLKVTSGATNGYILTSDASGNGSWTALALPSGSTELSPVISILSTPPTASTIGDRYLILSAATGSTAWSAHTNNIGQALDTTGGTWTFTTASTNNTVFVTNTLTTYLYNGSSWIPYNGQAILQNGNAYGNAITIGSNDNNSLNFKTSGTTKLSLSSSINPVLTLQSPISIGSSKTSFNILQSGNNSPVYTFGFSLYEDQGGNFTGTNNATNLATRASGLISAFAANGSSNFGSVVLSGNSIAILPSGTNGNTLDFIFAGNGFKIDSPATIANVPGAELHLAAAGFYLNTPYPGFNKGAQLRVDGSTIVTQPALSGVTVSGFSINSFGISSIYNNGVTGTITDATTVYIDGAPLGSAGATITRPWSLYVNSGNTLFAGLNYFGGTGITPTASVHIVGSTSGTSSLRIASGITVTNPNKGDVWSDGTNLNIGLLGVKIMTGSSINIGTGTTNASSGKGTLVAGVATISSTTLTSNSLPFVQDTGGGIIANIGTLYVTNVIGGPTGSFTVNSTNALDTSTFNWFFIN